MGKRNTYVLFDNWGLELANAILSKGTCSGPYMEIDSASFHSRNGLNGDVLAVLALVNTIESIVTHGILLYPEGCADWWRHRANDGLSLLTQFLEPVSLPEKANNYLDTVSEDISSKMPFFSGESPFITKGSVYYMALGKIMEIPYQPCPLRADFIFKTNLKSQFDIHNRSKMLEYIEGQSSNLCFEINKAMGCEYFETVYPALAGYIFSQCNCVEDIPKVVLEVRLTPQAIAFRQWLESMDTMWYSQNVSGIIREMNKVRGIFQDLKDKYDINPAENKMVKLLIRWPSLITIWPSAELSFEGNVDLFFQRNFCHQKAPMIFLKKIVSNLISIKGCDGHLTRLFGIKNVDSSFWNNMIIKFKNI